MSQVVLAAHRREERGSGASRRLRRAGRVPGILYGRAVEPISIDLDARDFANGIRNISESTIVKVEIDGVSHDAFVKDTQRNIIEGSIMHVDFYEVDQKVALRAHVSIHLKGNPIGVRNGGILEFPLHDIEVECLPKDLPERIELDIATLDVNESIHVRDIPLADSIRVISASDQVVALVKYARDDAADAALSPEDAAAAAAGPAAAEPASAPAKE